MLENPNLHSIDFSQPDGEFLYQEQTYQFKQYLGKDFFRNKSFQTGSYIYSVKFFTPTDIFKAISTGEIEQGYQYQLSEKLMQRCIQYENTIFCFDLSSSEGINRGEYCSLKSQYWIMFKWKPFQQLSLDDILEQPEDFFVKQAVTIYFPNDLQVDEEEIHPVLRATYKFEGEEPLEFICGSESELRRLTKMVFTFTELQPLFEESYTWEVIYNSNNKYDEGGLMGVYNEKFRFTHMLFPKDFDRLLNLILKHNFFVGLKLQLRHQKPGYAWRDRCSHEIRVTVQPPSQHERLEAAFELQSWLKGKLPDDEIRAYFEG